LNVWGHCGGIAERFNSLALTPEAADELHKLKQVGRWLMPGIRRKGQAAALRGYALKQFQFSQSMAI
jgi:hypothetical protein